jgi:branched-chain amino acid transport system ATP-binding protein
VTSLLAVSELSVAYGKRRALDGIALEVGAGEIVTLLGANGAGKSTVLRAISGLVNPVRGRVVYDGRDITGWSADAVVALGVGHVPEGREVFPAFTVEENLLVGGHTVTSRELATRLDEAWALFPVLRERRSQRAGTLSGGEQQMLAIARALVARPRLLLLDEPSLGLAPLVAREIFRVIRQVNAAGVTILLVEQHARRALGIASRAYVLETGRIVAQGSAVALAADHAIRTAYLGFRDQSGTVRRGVAARR